MQGREGNRADPGEAALHRLHHTGVDIGGVSEVSPGQFEGVTVRASGQYVPVGDRLVPEWVELDQEGDSGSPSVSTRVEVREGVPRVVRVSFESKPGQGEVRQRDLRNTEVSALLTLIAAYAVEVLDYEGEGRVEVTTSVDPETGDVWPASLEAVARARAARTITPEFLAEVAEVYRANLKTGPTKAVRERFFVSERQASNYVRAARDLGLLPETTKGKKKA